MARSPQRTAAPFVPSNPTLPRLKQAAAGCTGCDLYQRATQTVFGEGAVHAQVMFVGEQPGDKEDQQGQPFVGPAGGILNRCLEAAGIDRSRVYVTNAVKHFKWEPRGKRRIHKKPNQLEITACRPWLDAEIAVVRPQVIVALGATAAQALLGRGFKVTQRRGEPIMTKDGLVVATVHPSALLRAPDDETRHQETARFIDDLKVVSRLLRQRKAA